MLSDKHRGLKAAVAAALLAALGARYAWVATHLPRGWERYTADPAAHDGGEVIFPLYTVTGIEGPDRYAISKVLRDVPVEGATAGLAIGQTISVRATFRAADRVAVEVEREAHPWRKGKEILGLVGLAICALAAPFAFAWRGGRLVERG